MTTGRSSARIERVDVCIIGSGAGGSVLAYEAARRDLRTLVLERGPYVRGSDMTHDEAEMIPRLYKDGGLQFNTTMDLVILQGSCVGGSTVLANMVLIRPPASVFAEWRRLGAAIDLSTLAESYEKVERALDASPVFASNVSSSTKLFREGAAAIGMEPRWMTKALGDCVGCGDCNVGCAFDAKRSALTTFIPWAEAAGARVLAETTVERIRHRKGRVTRLEATTGPDRAPLVVEARQVVVAAGAIGSSALLLKSGITKNVGTRVSFNAGSMMTADFGRPLDAFDADQMTTYVQGDGWLIEPTHYPLLSAALATPGWMNDHHGVMRSWRNIAYAGALVPTEPTGRVVQSWLTGHEETRFRATRRDLGRLKAGLKAIASAFFAAGAERVYLPTHSLQTLSSVKDLHRVDTGFSTPSEICFGSAHPQGGNPLSDDRGLGAVDHDFALHGFENLFVCDASVFPTPLGVNPISTIMALADYAAPRIFARA